MASVAQRGRATPRMAIPEGLLPASRARWLFVETVGKGDAHRFGSVTKSFLTGLVKSRLSVPRKHLTVIVSSFKTCDCHACVLDAYCARCARLGAHMALRALGSTVRVLCGAPNEWGIH